MRRFDLLELRMRRCHALIMAASLLVLAGLRVAVGCNRALGSSMTRTNRQTFSHTVVFDDS